MPMMIKVQVFQHDIPMALDLASTGLLQVSPPNGY
jgi:hypothetical protein